MLAIIDFGWTQSQRSKAQPLQMEGRGEVPALANVAASRVVVARTKIPANYRGYLLSYGVTVRSPNFDYSGNIGFSLLIGDTPYFSNETGQWTLERGSVASPLPIFIQFDGPKFITFIATRLIDSAQPDTVDFSATGLFIPMQQEKSLNCP
jgi:hypothetical protein